VTRAVRYLIGVKGVKNNIVIDSRLSRAINNKIIQRALKNHVAIHAASITVEVSGNGVTLEGAVDFRYPKRAG